MLVQLTTMDPIWTLFIVIGILTLFGKKKKDEKENEETAEASTSSSASSPNPPMASTPLRPPAMNANVSYQPPRNWQGPPQGDEDSSLSRLLQSLLRDMPSDANS